MLRLKELLFPSIADVAVLSVGVNIEPVRVDAQCIADGAVCPVCGAWSNRVHGSYLRFPTDVPSGGRSVVLQLRVCRFICGNSGCARRTFVEQIPGLTRRHGQRTERLRSTLAAVGLALAGRAGARIARVLGAPVSRSTVLRLVDALPDPEVPAPRVVGVDEYATRKGRHYGIALVDIESRRPVDLLPDREASSLAATTPSCGWASISRYTDSLTESIPRTSSIFPPVCDSKTTGSEQTCCAGGVWPRPSSARTTGSSTA